MDGDRDTARRQETDIIVQVNKAGGLNEGHGSRKLELSNIESHSRSKTNKVG